MSATYQVAWHPTDNDSTFNYYDGLLIGNSEDKIICDINVDCNVVVAGAALKRFLANNIDTVGKINFHNVFNPIVKTYLEDMTSKFGVEVEFIDYGIQLEVQEVSNELVA